MTCDGAGRRPNAVHIAVQMGSTGDLSAIGSQVGRARSELDLNLHVFADATPEHGLKASNCAVRPAPRAPAL